MIENANVKEQILNGFPETFWKYVAQDISHLYDAFCSRDTRIAFAAIEDLEQLVGAGDTADVCPAEMNRSYRYWYGKLADSLHLRDVQMLRYSIAGMRLCIETIYRKELKWQKKKTRRAE